MVIGVNMRGYIPVRVLVLVLLSVISCVLSCL